MVWWGELYPIFFNFAKILGRPTCILWPNTIDHGTKCNGSFLGGNYNYLEYVGLPHDTVCNKEHLAKTGTAEKASFAILAMENRKVPLLFPWT